MHFVMCWLVILIVLVLCRSSVGLRGRLFLPSLYLAVVVSALHTLLLLQMLYSFFVSFFLIFSCSTYFQPKFAVGSPPWKQARST